MVTGHCFSDVDARVYLAGDTALVDGSGVYCCVDYFGYIKGPATRCKFDVSGGEFRGILRILGY